VTPEAETQKTVLVVDDHRHLRALVRASLESAGFNVLEATDGDEALASVRTARPDLIVLDIMMPRVSGWEVIADLLAERSTDEIPIVFISARTEVADRLRAFDLGAQGYITKPFDPDALVETVSTVLQQIESGEREAALAETLAALRKEQLSAGKASSS
jgi:DNA-binding response OmpR family regulator